MPTYRVVSATGLRDGFLHAAQFPHSPFSAKTHTRHSAMPGLYPGTPPQEPYALIRSRPRFHALGTEKVQAVY